MGSSVSRQTYVGYGRYYNQECNCGVDGYCGGSEHRDVLPTLNRYTPFPSCEIVHTLKGGSIKVLRAIEFRSRSNHFAFTHGLLLINSKKSFV